MNEPCGNCEVCSQCVNADAELHEQFGQPEAERDTLQNRVYELEHTIQHWETDYEHWKDDVQELTAERDALRVASKACRERNEVLCAERDALKTEVETARLAYNNLFKNATGYESERDALKASTERQQAANDILDDTIGKLAADNERLRANVEATRSALAAWVDRDAAKTVQLTELREAVEAVRDGAELELDVSDSIAYVDNEALKSLLALLAKLPPR